MEDQRWIRLVTIGLVLAAMAVGYFLLAQRFTGTRVSDGNRVSKSQPTPTPSVAPSGAGQATQSAYVSEGKASSAYQRIAERTRNNTQTLPATGSPVLLVGLLSIAATVVGFGLRKFHH